ncbi:hypothetical protein Tco_0842880 [Tanacetum coccineum]|uniref:Xylulose kinase-1 n=1 Tax=Tanacetum coccineum TaxID=301880 RepID=A0ABQ5B4F7_9ASTR
MTTLQFANTHNLVAFLTKSAESEGFEQMMDFLNASSIKYALTVNPTIYTSCIEQFWSTVKAKTVNREVQLQALVDGKKIAVTEASVRRDLQLEDADGVNCLPNAIIFEQLTLMGYEKLSQKLIIHTILQCLSAKTTAWNEFSSTMASAIICLATNKKFNFSKYIFESMVKNLDIAVQFLMKQKSRRPKEKDTAIPHSSVPSDPTNIANEAVTEDPKDASKQGRIDDIDADKDIYLVNVHKDEDMFGVNDLEGDEIVVESEVADQDVNLSVDEVTLAQALAALKSAKVQEKRDVIKEPSVPVSATSTKVITVIPTTASTIITAVSSRPIAKGIVKDKGKGKMVEEEPMKKMSKKELLKLDKELAFKLQAEEDEEEMLAREKA